jgi:hypothetical protein
VCATGTLSQARIVKKAEETRSLEAIEKEEKK